MPTLTNETCSTEPSIHTSITPDLPSVEDLKSQFVGTRILFFLL
jgi:hypothetical protein